MESDHNILRDRSFENYLPKTKHRESLKPSEYMKDHAEMDQHQEFHEKENYNPRPLKEIAAKSQTDLNKTATLPAEPANNNNTFTNEGDESKATNTTFDQTSDDESYMSTNNESFGLSEGFNNIKLDGDEQTPLVNSTMHADAPAVNTTLTIESPPISEYSQRSNATLTEDHSKDLESVPSPGQAENTSAKNITDDDIAKANTLDEIEAILEAAAQTVNEIRANEDSVQISPIPHMVNEISSEYISAHEIPTLESNINSDSFEISQNANKTISITEVVEDAQENNSSSLTNSNDYHHSDIVSPDHSEIPQEVNLTMSVPMEIDQTLGDDITNTQEPASEVHEEIEKSLEQRPECEDNNFESMQKFEEEDLKSEQTQEFEDNLESVQKIEEELKSPQLAQATDEFEISPVKLEMESPPGVELFHQSPETERSEDEFKVPKLPKRLSAEKFESAATYNFGNFDLDILQKFGTNPTADFSNGRDSVLLRFDPLLEKIAPVEVTNQRLTPTANTTTRLCSTKEEDEYYSECQSFSDKEQEQSLVQVETFTTQTNRNSSNYTIPTLPSNADTSAMKDIEQGTEIIESVHETKEFKDLSISDNNQQVSQQQEIDFSQKMTELESQLRKEAEIKEEALLKRITEKEKQMAKMNNVVEAYEKAISELIAEKEQLAQNYEKKCLELRSDSETNSHHLASLESTFSDLHAKYERTKQLASELKEREETIIQDRKALQESLKLQEARYEKMKMHAMSQLEIANNKLADMQRNHQAEVTKLKAQLKKEEISRASVNEQLIQKSKENAELVKICDELIGNHGHSQNA